MDGRHPLGTVALLWRYPIKSLAAERLQHAEIALGGLVGDRRRALFVTSERHARSERTYRGKEHNLLHTIETIERAQGLAEQRNLDLAERDDGPFFDAEPISIVFDCWIRDLEILTGLRLDPQRFRPNLYVRAAPGFDASEAALVGRTIEVGGACLEVVSAISRCVTITYDVQSGDPNPFVHRVLAQERDNVMGVYCRTAQPGSVSLDDVIY